MRRIHFFVMIRGCIVVLYVIYLEDFLSYLRITMPFKEMCRLWLDGAETMSYNFSWTKVQGYIIVLYWTTFF